MYDVSLGPWLSSKSIKLPDILFQFYTGKISVLRNYRVYHASCEAFERMPYIVRELKIV